VAIGVLGVDKPKLYEKEKTVSNEEILKELREADEDVFNEALRELIAEGKIVAAVEEGKEVTDDCTRLYPVSEEVN
jgi:nucleoside diphosphate kinase